MAPIGRKEIRIKIPVNWIYGIFLVAGALIVGFVLAPTEQRPVLVFAAAVLAGVAASITAANNIDQRQAAVEKADKDAAKAAEQAGEDAKKEAAQVHQARIAATMAFCDRWNDPAFFSCKLAGRGIRDFIRAHQGDVSAQLTYLREVPERNAALVDILNRFEALNIAIENSVMDDDTAKHFFRSIVSEYWHLTEDVIKKLRAEHGSARLYKEFETLYGRWK